MRYMAKSMNVMRGAFNKHPSSLTPVRSQRPSQPPLPVISRPSTGGGPPGNPPYTGVPSTGEHLPTPTDTVRSPDNARAVASPSGYPRLNNSQYANASPSANGSYLGFPSTEPYPRARSALGESSSGPAPFSPPRYIHSPQNSETTYDAAAYRYPLASVHGQGTAVPASSRYEDTSSYTFDRFPCTARPPPRSPVARSSSVPSQNGFSDCDPSHVNRLGRRLPSEVPSTRTTVHTPLVTST